MKKATTVTMLRAGGGPTVFGVFHSRVRVGVTGSWSWNVHRAIHIGTVTLGPDEQADYNAMAQRFATPDYPAWQY